MLYSIKITKLAKDEIKNTAKYIFMNSFSEEIANKVYDEIYSKIYSLSIFPERFPFYNKDYRVMTIIWWKYRIFYKINSIKNQVIIHYFFASYQNYNKYI